MRYLTKIELFEACKNHPYILARYQGRDLVGINSRIITLSRIKAQNPETDFKETNYTGFQPCNFNEYISHKTKFL